MAYCNVATESYGIYGFSFFPHYFSGHPPFVRDKPQTFNNWIRIYKRDTNSYICESLRKSTVPLLTILIETDIHKSY